MITTGQLEQARDKPDGPSCHLTDSVKAVKDTQPTRDNNSLNPLLIHRLTPQQRHHSLPAPWWIRLSATYINPFTHTHNRFTALFPGPPGWPSARRELLDFYGAREDNRGRHTDHPAWRHSIWTNHRVVWSQVLESPWKNCPFFQDRESPWEQCRASKVLKFQ